MYSKASKFFSVSNDGFEWSSDFRPDSVTLVVEDLVQEMTIISQEFFSAAWSWLLSQRQDFLNNHAARVPITPKQEGTMEMRDEVLSSVRAQDMDTNSYQVSDLDNFDFYRENDQLDVDAVLRSGIDSTFSPAVFNDLEMGDSAENLILLDEEENFPPTTPVSERPTEHRVLLRSLPFGTRCSGLLLLNFVSINFTLYVF